MGDRTYVRIAVHPLDWHLVYNLFDADESISSLKALVEQRSEGFDSSKIHCSDWISLQETPYKAVEVEVYEANYGWYDEMHEAASTGARFYGYHSYGGDYDCGECIGYGFKAHYLRVTREQEPYARVLGGEVVEDDVRQIREHIEAENKFIASVNLLPPTWEEIIELCPPKTLNG